MTYSLNRVEIDLSALRANYRRMQEIVGERVRVMAIVKADGYGHGMIRAAQAFSEAGARTFGVAEAEEGVLLREAGVEGEIVVLLGVGLREFEDVLHYRLQPVVYDKALLAGLSEYAHGRNVCIGVHLKVDAGMGRLGAMPEEVPGLIEMASKLPGVFLAGIMSHFSESDNPASGKTMEQYRRFEGCCRAAQTFLRQDVTRHVANTAAVVSFPETHLDMVRSGIGLYGYCPACDGNTASRVTFEPAMRFASRVSQVKDVPAGFGVSYGHTFVTSRPTRLAVLPVGYDDGYLRRLSNRAKVLIHGRRASVLGNVCMNACVADVTDLPSVHPGDEVVLMGRQGAEVIDANEVAGWMETISYEVLCLFGSRNRRGYRETGSADNLS